MNQPESAASTEVPKVVVSETQLMRRFNAEKAINEWASTRSFIDNAIRFSMWLAEEVEITCPDCGGTGIMHFMQGMYSVTRPCYPCHKTGKIKIQRVDTFFEEVQAT